MKNNCLALVLARAGSKGLKNKNIKKINGKPLIKYTTDELKKSKIFDKIIISTDSKSIINLYKNDKIIGTPFLRPKKISQDNSKASEAIFHALNFVKNNYGKFKFVCYCFPTSPLKKAQDFKNVFNILKINKKLEMVISVCETSKPIQWQNYLKKNKSLKNFVSISNRKKNRQFLKKSYVINGSIFFAKWDVFYKDKDWFKINSKAYIMPKERSVDIDSYLDFKLAETLLKK